MLISDVIEILRSSVVEPSDEDPDSYNAGWISGYNSAIAYAVRQLEEAAPW